MSSPEHSQQSDRTSRSPSAGHKRLRARLAAVGALIVSVGFLVILLSLVADDLDGLVAAFVWVFVTAFFGWLVVTRRGYLRLLGVPLVLIGVVGLITYAYDHKMALPVLIGVLALFGLAARYAVRHTTAELVRGHARLAEPPRRGVLIINPKSGGGKAERFNLPEEARKRSIEPLVLGPDVDLCELARRAIVGGASIGALAACSSGRRSSSRFAPVPPLLSGSTARRSSFDRRFASSRCRRRCVSVSRGTRPGFRLRGVQSR